jgi:hypothetical protein
MGPRFLAPAAPLYEGQFLGQKHCDNEVEEMSFVAPDGDFHQGEEEIREP